MGQPQLEEEEEFGERASRCKNAEMGQSALSDELIGDLACRAAENTVDVSFMDYAGCQ